MITYEVSQNEINSLVSRLSGLDKALINSTIIEKIAIDIKERIRLRTQGGKDVNYSSFKKYSLDYSIQEGKTLVNLTNTGEMLNSMTQKVMSNDTIKIFFSNKRARELAKKHQFGDGVPVREFFGVGTKDREFAMATYRKSTAKELSKRGF